MTDHRSARLSRRTDGCFTSCCRRGGGDGGDGGVILVACVIIGIIFDEFDFGLRDVLHSLWSRGFTGGHFDC